MCQVIADDLVEWLGNDFTVEILDIEFDLIGRGKEVDLIAVRVEDGTVSPTLHLIPSVDSSVLICTGGSWSTR